MIRLRVLVGVVAVALLTVGLLPGDEPNTGDTKKDDATTRVRGTLPPNYKKLGLSDDQVQKIYKIQNEYRAQIDQLQAKVKQLQKEEREEMAKVLTDAQ